MGKDDNQRSRGGLFEALAVGVRDVVIILAAFALLGVLGVYIVNHYSSAADATSVLGVVIPAISTIAGTAFGVAAGARAGAAAGDATARAAQSETEAVKTQTREAAGRVGELRSELNDVLNAAGSTTALPSAEVDEARTKLKNVEQSLRAAL